MNAIAILSPLLLCRCVSKQTKTRIFTCTHCHTSVISKAKWVMVESVLYGTRWNPTSCPQMSDTGAYPGVSLATNQLFRPRSSSAQTHSYAGPLSITTKITPALASLRLTCSPTNQAWFWGGGVEGWRGGEVEGSDSATTDTSCWGDPALSVMIQ